MANPAYAVGFQEAARRRLPRFAYDFIAGGAGHESGLQRASARVQDVRLIPRVLTGCEDRSTTTQLLDTSYAAPFGVAPTGLTNLAWPGTDEALAAEAERFGIPYVISTPATASLERLAELAPNSAWFQLYVGRDEPIWLDLVERAKACGISTLVVTADVPVPGRRLRDVRNQFSLPIRVSPARLFDLLAHPAWTLATLRAGLPRFANLERYSTEGQGTQSLAKLMAAQSSAKFDWATFEELRARWHGRLVLKGVLHPSDADQAVRCGADAIVVSSHGGRQLDSAPAPIEMLGSVGDAVAGRAAVMLDGGLQSGEDIARALALGAEFVFIGRAFLWAAAALGPAPGARAAIHGLHQELLATMGQLGCRTVMDLANVDVLPTPGLVGRSRASTAGCNRQPCRPIHTSGDALHV